MNYKTFKYQDGWYVIDALSSDHFGGPYDTEEKAKRRIRDLKRKEKTPEQKFEEISVAVEAERLETAPPMITELPKFNCVAGAYPHISKHHRNAMAYPRVGFAMPSNRR